LSIPFHFSFLEKRGLFEPTVVVVDLDNVSIGAELSILTAHDIFLAGELGEPPLGGLQNLLASSELELSTAKGLHDVVSVGVLSANRNQNLADRHTGSSADGLTVRVTHTGTEAISSGARKHLVSAEDVEGVGAHADVVGVLSDGLGQMLVDGNTGSLKSLGGDLLLLVAHHVADEGEEIDSSLLGSNIEDTDLGVWHSTAVPTLDVGLVLLVTVATGRAASHVLIWDEQIKGEGRATGEIG
jgi:hypothetical protein